MITSIIFFTTTNVDDPDGVMQRCNMKWHTNALAWLEKYAIAMGLIATAMGLLIALGALFINIHLVDTTVNQYNSDRSSELKIIESQVNVINGSLWEINGEKVYTRKFVVHFSVVNSITARYPAKIINVSDISYIFESDGKAASDLDVEDEIWTPSPRKGIVDWNEPYTKLVYPGEVYSDMRFEIEVLMYGNYTIVLNPSIEYYDPFKDDIRHSNDTSLFIYKIEDDNFDLLEQNRIIT